jgi:hypothetical protein
MLVFTVYTNNIYKLYEVVQNYHNQSCERGSMCSWTPCAFDCKPGECVDLVGHVHVVPMHRIADRDNIVDKHLDPIGAPHLPFHL